MRRIIMIVLGVALLSGAIVWRVHTNSVAAKELQQGGGGAGRGGGGRRGGPAVVAETTVGVRDVVNTFSTTANIESPQTVKLSPKLAGQITMIAVKEGDAVRRGQVLVKLDDSELRSTVRKEQALLAVSRAHLLQAEATEGSTLTPLATQIVQNQATIRSAEANYNQLKDTYAQQVAAADAAVTDAESKVAAAQASVANAQAALRSAQANESNANTALSRQAALFSQGAVAQQDVDNARTAASVQTGNVGVAQAQVNAALANLKSSQAQLNSAKNTDVIAKRKSQSDIQAAHATLVQAQQQLKNSRANTDQRAAYQANLAALRADVQSTQADLVNAQVQLSQTVLTSPIDGFVSSRLADPGTLASPGTVILNLQGIRQVWVNVPVPQEQIGHIAIGQEATITLDTLPGRKFIGRVFQINPSADPANRNFTIRVALDNSQQLLKPGMFARVTLETARVPHATVVPLEAIQTDETGSYVWTVTMDPVDPSAPKPAGTGPGKAPSGTVTRKPITLGLSDDNGSVVLSGLSPGDKVVSAGQQRLKDGAKVTISAPGGGKKGGRNRGHKPAN